MYFSKKRFNSCQPKCQKGASPPKLSGVFQENAGCLWSNGSKESVERDQTMFNKNLAAKFHIKAHVFFCFSFPPSKPSPQQKNTHMFLLQRGVSEQLYFDLLPTVLRVEKNIKKTGLPNMCLNKPWTIRHIRRWTTQPMLVETRWVFRKAAIYLSSDQAMLLSYGLLYGPEA